jgi:hypothetical protein
MKHHNELLSITPATKMEQKLQVTLQAATVKVSQQKKQIVTLQSAAVLNGACCDLVCGQLTAQEKSKKKQQKACWRWSSSVTLIMEICSACHQVS